MHACYQSHNQAGGGAWSCPEIPHSKLHSQNKSVSLCTALQNTNNHKKRSPALGIAGVRREATTPVELPRGRMQANKPAIPFHANTVTVGLAKERVGMSPGRRQRIDPQPTGVNRRKQTSASPRAPTSKPSSIRRSASAHAEQHGALQTAAKYASYCLACVFSAALMIDSVSSLCPIDLIPPHPTQPPSHPPPPPPRWITPLNLKSFQIMTDVCVKPQERPFCCCCCWTF